MASSKPLKREFYDRPTLEVTQALLGTRLVRQEDGLRLAGIITETEAYVGSEDLGSHAHVGRTRRNQVMFGPPGHAYVYFTYGVHWCFNVVTERVDYPAAVLIRAFAPTEGLEVISRRRSGRDTFGPAKLTQALHIDGNMNGLDLCDAGSGLWIEAGLPVEASQIIARPRVGFNNVPEPWKSIPWNFSIDPFSLPGR